MILVETNVMPDCVEIRAGYCLHLTREPDVTIGGHSILSRCTQMDTSEPNSSGFIFGTQMVGFGRIEEPLDGFQ